MAEMLTEDRALAIREAISADPTFFMSEGWLQQYSVTRDECETFLDYAVRLARMYDWRRVNAGVGAVVTTLTFTNHNAKVGDTEEKWTCFAPLEDTMRILAVAETGRLSATLVPEDMPTEVFDAETGEIL